MIAAEKLEGSPNRTEQSYRQDFAFLTLAGQSVSVRTNDGAVWDGIFVSVEATEAVVLYAAVRSLVGKHNSSGAAVWYDKCFIPIETVMSISAIDIKMQTGNTATEKVASVARPAVPVPANLSSMKWDEDVLLEDFEAEEKNWKQGKSWDQFGENERRFGVKTTYDASLYTTKLGNCTAAQIATAERIAKEIESSAAGGIHQRIERGEDLDIDEGELYSDVKRVDNRKSSPQAPAPSTAVKSELPTGKTGSYVPPSRRNQSATSPAPSVAAPQPVTATSSTLAAPSPAAAISASPAPAASAPTTSPASTNASAPKLTSQPAQASAPSNTNNMSNVGTASKNASAGDAPKGSSLNVEAKAWTPSFVPLPPSLPTEVIVPTQPPQPPMPPVVDFAKALRDLALKSLLVPSAPSIAVDTEWFPDYTHQSQGGVGGGYSSGGGQYGVQYGGPTPGWAPNGPQSGFSTAIPGHGMGQAGGFGASNSYGSGGGHMQHMSGGFAPQHQPQPGQGFGRGRGAMSRGGIAQPQQPASVGRGGGQMGGGMPIGHPSPAPPQQISAPQPLDGGAPAIAPQPEPVVQEPPKPKMKRGR